MIISMSDAQSYTTEDVNRNRLTSESEGRFIQANVGVELKGVIWS